MRAISVCNSGLAECTAHMQHTHMFKRTCLIFQTFQHDILHTFFTLYVYIFMLVRMPINVLDTHIYHTLYVTFDVPKHLHIFFIHNSRSHKNSSRLNLERTPAALRVPPQCHHTKWLIYFIVCIYILD